VRSLLAFRGAAFLRLPSTPPCAWAVKHDCFHDARRRSEDVLDGEMSPACLPSRPPGHTLLWRVRALTVIAPPTHLKCAQCLVALACSLAAIGMASAQSHMVNYRGQPASL